MSTPPYVDAPQPDETPQPVHTPQTAEGPQVETPLDLRIGASGWSYKDWIGPFYPDGTTNAGMLRAYAERYHTVEIDSTFYGTPRSSTVQRWADETPDGFVFSAKVPQRITHEKELVDCRDELARFVDTMSILGGKLGPLLFQFPYGFRSDKLDLLTAFLEELPPGVRFALEVRHKSWLGDPFYSLLRRTGVALALIDHPWMPRLDTVTADFLYVRWLGDRKAVDAPFNTVRIDRTRDLLAWRDILRRAAVGLVTFGYFNNHYAGYSPALVDAFTAMIGET